MANKGSTGKCSLNSVDSSPKFKKKWSRNFSANRQRELDRLNQIEHRRQILEARRQNDLLDQMSFTVNNLKIVENSVLAAPVKRDETPRSEVVDGFNKNQISVSVPYEEANNDQVQQQPHLHKALPHSISPLSVSQPEDKKLPKSLDSNSKEFSVSKLNDELNDVSGSVHPHELEQADTSFQRKCAAEEKDLQSSGRTDYLNDRKLDKHNPKAEDALMSRQQLNEFVSLAVPKNKRILCLIVRDKLSRINRTKSYFYPTYYLFIQAIVDIDEPVVMDKMLINNSNENLAVREANVQMSAENSFSGSSSISADMMFIGADSSLIDGVTAGAGGPSRLINNPGNSYSDNELCDDTETEEDPVGRRSSQVQSNSIQPTDEKNGNNKAAAATDNAIKLEHGNESPGKGESQRTPPIGYPTSAALVLPSLSGNLITTAKSDYARDGLVVDEDDDLDGEDGDLDDDCDSDNADYLTERRSAMPASVHQQFARDSGNNGTSDQHITKEARSMNCADFFDNDKNPLTGTYGVVLAGRRRKKAKT